MGIDHSMNFAACPEGTRAMFQKEKLSRSALYNKLAGGMSFEEAKSEKFFVDDDEL